MDVSGAEQSEAAAYQIVDIYYSSLAVFNERPDLPCKCTGTWGRCSQTFTKNKEIQDKSRNLSKSARVRRKGSVWEKRAEVSPGHRESA